MSNSKSYSNYYRNSNQNFDRTSSKKDTAYSFSSKKKPKGHIKDID